MQDDRLAARAKLVSLRLPRRLLVAYKEASLQRIAELEARRQAS